MYLGKSSFYSSKKNRSKKIDEAGLYTLKSILQNLRPNAGSLLGLQYLRALILWKKTKSKLTVFYHRTRDHLVSYLLKTG